MSNFDSSFTLYVRNAVYMMAAWISALSFLPARPKLVIYCYHSISGDGWRFSTPKSEFKRQILFLLEKKHNPISLRDVEEYISGRKKLVRDSFVITFDDGYRNILAVKEFLHQCAISPAIFVLSNPMHANHSELNTPQREFLSAKDIKDLKEAGWDVGCHSATHADFAHLSHEEVLSEVRDSKAALESMLEFPIYSIAYPKGAYTHDVLCVVKDSGYKYGLSMDDGYIAEKADPFVLPRVGVDGTHTMRQFPYLASPFAIMARKLIKKFL